MDLSFITTFAAEGNGGSISINGNDLIYLKNSGFLTSVSGLHSNGGEIKVSSHQLVMETGVMQANAVSGSGGNINLSVKALISSQNKLIKAGSRLEWQPFQLGFNLIQAASETGVSGSVNLQSPQFDLSGSISGLKTTPLALPLTDRAICATATNPSSHLMRGSKGGIPVSEAKAGFIPSADFFNAENNAKGTASKTKRLDVKMSQHNKKTDCVAQPF
jgi:hypothetical protein